MKIADASVEASTARSINTLTEQTMLCDEKDVVFLISID